MVLQTILAGKSRKKKMASSRRNISIAEELTQNLQPQSFTKLDWEGREGRAPPRSAIAVVDLSQ